MRRIAIHSVPRSGSSWLGQLFNSSPEVIYKYQPLFSYSFKGRLTPHSTSQDVINLFEEITLTRDDFLDQNAAIRRGIYPKFAKSDKLKHVVYKEVRYHHILPNLLARDPQVIVIGLVRNPLAVLTSWYKAPKEFNPDWDFGREWRKASLKNRGKPEEFYGFEKWCEVAALFLRLSECYGPRFLLVRYKDLISDTEAVVRRLFKCCHIEFTDQTRDFLASSRANHVDDAYSVFRRKSRDDAWQTSLPSEIVEGVLAELDGSDLEQFLL